MIVLLVNKMKKKIINNSIFYEILRNYGLQDDEDNL